MLKYLVGYFDADTNGFREPYIIIKARNRASAAGQYDERFSFVPGAGRVMALMTLFGPMNLDPMCPRDLAARALETIEELQ